MAGLKVILFFLAELVMASAYMNYSNQCESISNDTIKVIQGEALRLHCPNFDCANVKNNSKIFWFKKENAKIQPIMMKENERVHYHGGILYFLPLNLNDTGLYITQWWYDVAQCDEFVTEVVVYEKFHPNQLYPILSEQIHILPYECPVWQNTGENITWYKDFRLIPEKTDVIIQIYLLSKDANGIYTCVCTWEHHGQVYNSSGSRYIQRKKIEVPFRPTFQYPINNSVDFVDLGSDVKLDCRVFLGINIRESKGVYWMRNNSRLDCSNRMDNLSVRSTLTITQVSMKDLENEYCCVAISHYQWALVCITLRPRESLLPVAAVFSGMFLFILLAVGMVKWVTVDLVLIIRSFRIMQFKRNDGKLYDAYVIYQKDNPDEKTGRKAAYFVNEVLPAVLENSCGFKLYIQGRDDLPGEDCTELIERKMRQSRRLIAVLPPGFNHHGFTTSLCYDWHVGLHHVLVEQDMGVILIQLEDMKEYSHLPLGLQHLLQKTSPFRWDESSGKATCPTSCFWKQVRYKMPVPPDSSSCGVDF
ncbi:interleukin-1 receptor-like 1 isoform X2 [Silurus meridionalis]|uniref:interleukin-1 receptor-like 1 isoform X2 n=1 Tax=Silurus meridionalis TaxID=175797 RepID=UPI001EE9AF5E|nr:interleukin-1 receptor-like 1 isoform X2 [Silurus meridionalis]